MRPPTPTPGHRGIPSTQGYSRDPEGTRQWLEDVRDHADRDASGAVDLSPLQRWALNAFGLWGFVHRQQAMEFARGRLYVANTALSIFPSPAPKGWGSTD